ncbi:hypothetical protein SAMN04487969_119131 [Paenibacillus algorifonticola]|uniref:TnsE C-terminal domain-containing protein n=1 Tax=Paenibacillus algorifonticola TaxID=684063 RepID=A0A1I2H4G7_9BACL|nr:Tn7-like element transposition protein TnsE [Paenibacillus algorifonticola]SFF23897.1 hypothetical protein SAMN04487969_119131 [Paenibacillus algorifonticola]
MASLTLRSWPFRENEEVELLWFGSPYMDYKGNWRIKAAFRSASMVIKLVSYAWGTVPYMRIGQVYANGKFDPIKPLSGSSYRLTIDDMSSGTITNGFKLPRRLIDFGKNPELGLQKVIQFKVNNLTYCIPVIEFVRALFINSKTLATQLLQPHGLEMLIDKSDVSQGTLHFDMSLRVPANLATESNAQHLSWIYMDADIHSMWDSVYQNMFSQAIQDSPLNPNVPFKKGIPLNVNLSPIGPIEMYIRGEKFIDYILVKEIIGFSGFKHPHERILFWHPSKKMHEINFGEKKVRLTPRANANYILNEDSDNAKEDRNQDVLEAPPTFMRFSNSPIIKTRRKHVKRSNKGKDIIVKLGRGGKNIGAAKEVSTQDSIVGGDTPPIDFQTLETIPITEAIGLEAFFKMIQLLKETYSLKISMSILRIPSGKKFSVCPNGTRRTCAVVQIVNAKSITYLVEIARPDEWSISTLILRPTPQSSLKSIETNIKLLLDGLVQKGGHWDQTILSRFSDMSIRKVKHYNNDSIREWAIRLHNSTY